MTTGPPLYLVSACSSAEEFVAAFRRYADRTGLFVPSASPLPAGRRGRLALTLKDGGVMIEGEAEILQSSTKPTVLHGRPGMTVKFIEPDEPSKIVIGELEKARLAMKPAPPSVPPRPAQIPGEPRAVPPTPGGRIDAANSLAECVVIGDPSLLVVTANAPRSAMGDKFMVPSIPAVGGAPRPRTPSTPPERPKTPSTPPPSPRAKPPTVPPNPAATAIPPARPNAAAPKMTSIGFPAVDKLPANTDSSRIVSNATTLGMPALDRKPDRPDPALLSTQLGTDAPANPTAPSMPAQNPLLDTKLGHRAVRPDATPPRFVQNTTLPGTPTSESTAVGPPVVHEESTTIGQGPLRPPDPMAMLGNVEIDEEQTSIGAMPMKKTTDPMPAAVPTETKRSESSKVQKGTSIGFPAVRSPYETQPLGLVPTAHPSKFDPNPRSAPPDPSPPTLPKSARSQPPPSPRGKTPTTPPLTPRHPTPVAPVPIVRWPAKAAPSAAGDEEHTDLSTLPTATATPLDPVVPAESGSHKAAPAQRSGGMRASEILAAIPAGDWTMSPDESVPHALPPEAKLGGGAPPPEPTPAPGPPPKAPPTGDWTMSLDPATGWSEPEKIGGGNPVGAVSSDKPISVVQWEEKPTGIGESKIEIDSTLMEPQKAMPAVDDDEPAHIVDSKPRGDAPPRPASGFGSARGFSQPQYRPSVTDIVTDFPASEQDRAKRKKMILLAIGAGAIAIAAIVMLVLTLGGSKKPSQANVETPTGSAKVSMSPTQAVDAAAAQPHVAVGTGSGSETAPAVTVDAGTAAVAPAPPVATDKCSIEIKSLPSGADVYVDKQKLATTPGKIELPCGVEARLSLRKKSYPNTVRSFTPAADKSNRVLIKLSKPMVSVKVTSMPAGATIMAGGKSLGVTPTTIKLPANEATSLTLTKPGFASDTQRVSPKQNNATHHVMLKKGKAR